jgi:hypothetical protein
MSGVLLSAPTAIGDQNDERVAEEADSEYERIGDH